MPKKPFMSGYKTYQPEEEGFGNSRQWRGAYATAMGHEEAQERVNATGKSAESILQVPDGAPWALIRQLYRNACKLHHPDLHPDDPGAIDRFKALQAAYALLERKHGSR